jgi:hypothetical protein
MSVTLQSTVHTSPSTGLVPDIKHAVRPVTTGRAKGRNRTRLGVARRAASIYAESLP